VTVGRTLNPVQRRALVSCLRDVGPRKPVGYLPLDTLRLFAKVRLADMVRDAARRGLEVAVFRPKQCCIKSGALYLYDRAALSALLDANADLLTASGISAEPKRFVAYIAANWLEPTHPACVVIAKAFADTFLLQSLMTEVAPNATPSPPPSGNSRSSPRRSCRRSPPAANPAGCPPSARPTDTRRR
jgi:hypothetical protein